MNDYEAKQEARRERLLAAAEKAESSANQRCEQAMGMAHMMNGQPILIGHHSEKRHRRDIARMDSHMRRSVEESKRAKDLRGRAAGVGKGGISSDDPDSIAKLSAKLDSLERNRECMKRINAAWRKAGKPGPEDLEAWQKIANTVEMADNDLHGVRMRIARTPYHPQPFPAYKLTNLGANIRRIQERISSLQREDSAPEAAPVEREGFTIREDRDANRIRFEFDSKPPREVCRTMRQNGWRWSPTEGAWLRHLNNAGRHAAEYTAAQVEKAL